MDSPKIKSYRGNIGGKMDKSERGRIEEREEPSRVASI
jgi:hypothetical protein